MIHIRYEEVNRSQLPTPLQPTFAANRFYHVQASDNGIGFDQKHLETIFQVF